MALLSKKGASFKAMGFWIQHQDKTTWNSLSSYAIPINDLQKYTGIDFFCNLPDDIENEVENVSKSQLQKDWFN
jgi:endonuclease G